MGFRSNASRAGRPKLFEGQRVLLVEDTRLYTVAVRSLLETRFGLVVVPCSTFAALKRELDAGGKFDLAILDLCLADAPNGETLDHILACSIPAIVFSGYTSDARREEILTNRATELVYKNSPRSLESLAEAVERILAANQPMAVLIDPVADTAAELIAEATSNSFAVLHCRSVDQALAKLDASKGAIEIVIVRHDAISEADHALLETLALRFGDDSVRVVGFATEAVDGAAARFLKAGGDDFLQLPMSQADIEGRLEHILAIHRQIQSLQRMASRDYLTDMLNRRYFFDRGPKLVEMCLRQSAPVCAALLDIDHFKRLNDTYGHEIGDLVLKAVSRRLLQLVGEKQHLPARIGGEEFALLLTNMNIEQAYEFCERIRMDIAKTKIVVDDEDISVTVSMGLASISGSETFDNYLNAADQYLYLAKHSGRNRVFSDYQVLKIAAS